MARLLVLLLALILAPSAAFAEEKPQLALFGTIPVYWGEVGSFEGMISGEGEAHWARAELETRYTLVQLDTLATLGETDQAGAIDHLLLAQPRVLSPAENVALDQWVRDGGKLLLFADPLMTDHSHYAFGDRRRPQDVALLSPILGRWGLAMLFDEAQPDGERTIAFEGVPIPVNLSGSFTDVETNAPQTTCAIAASALIAECSIGAGRALIVADAAVLDMHAVLPWSRIDAMGALLDRGFSPPTP